MPLKLKLNAFSLSDFTDAQKKVLAYRNGLIQKCGIFVQKLANKGILVGEQVLGDSDEGYSRYITFGVDLEYSKYKCKGLMYATNTGIIKSQWMTKDGVKEADVSPLLMVEFGAGLRANNAWAATASHGKGGTGTFPGQTHAFDPEGWWYQDLGGEWHHSYGVTPTMPMGHALSEMMDQIHSTAMEVFGK